MADRAKGGGYRLYDVTVVQLKETYTVTCGNQVMGDAQLQILAFALEKVILVCKTSESERGRVWQKTFRTKKRLKECQREYLDFLHFQIMLSAAYLETNEDEKQDID